MNISKGKQVKAQRVVVYGPEGIGKTTFAAQFPKPVFIDIEGSSDHMDVARTDKPLTWLELMAMLDEFAKDNHGFSTLVIDTADWAEALAISEICKRAKVEAIGDVSYGKLYQQLGAEWRKFLEKLTKVIDNGMNVVASSHASLYKFEQPDEAGSYDRWGLKLTNSFKTNLSAMLKEWGDMVLFANYKTYVEERDGTNKVKGGKRVMYTSHHPAWDAKNRHSLEPELEFNFKQIAHCIPDLGNPATGNTGSQQQAQTPPEKTQASPQQNQTTANTPQPEQDTAFNSDVYKLMELGGITEDEVNAYLLRRGIVKEGQTIHNLPENVVSQMVKPENWEKVVSNIEEHRKQNAA